MINFNGNFCDLNFYCKHNTKKSGLSPKEWTPSSHLISLGLLLNFFRFPPKFPVQILMERMFYLKVKTLDYRVIQRDCRL